MNKLSLIRVAGFALMAATPALAADLPPQMPVKATFQQRFTWTGCYMGAHAGGVWAQTDATDPVLLVQDNPAFGLAGNTVGTTTANVRQSGAVIGGQIGCDYQFSPNFVVGIEGEASGSTLKGNTVVPFQPAVAFPGETARVKVTTDFIPSLTARVGYAVDSLLLYGKGGAAWAYNKYSVIGTFTGIPFDAEGLNITTGWTAGAGVEWAFMPDWSARLEYDYYDFGNQTVTMSHVDAAGVTSFTGPMRYKQTAQTVKLGVNFRVPAWE
jgi:outer membrane immunogenic protein